MKRFAVVLILAVTGLQPPSTAAATFTLTPSVVGRFDDAFSPLPFDPLAGGSILAGAGYYQIDFDFTISDLAPEEHGFMATGFDLQLTGGLADLGGSGWSPYVDEVDADGSIVGGGPRYAVNVDAGLDGLDYQRIVAAISPNLGSSDARTKLGIDSPARLGSVYLHWDGVTYSSLATREVSFAMSDVTGQFAQVPGISAGAVIEFGIPGPNDVRPIPQPAMQPLVELPPVELPPLEVEPPQVPDNPPLPIEPPQAPDVSPLPEVSPPYTDPPTVEDPPAPADPIIGTDPAAPKILLYYPGWTVPGYDPGMIYVHGWAREWLPREPGLSIELTLPTTTPIYVGEHIDGTFITAIDGELATGAGVLVSAPAVGNSSWPTLQQKLNDAALYRILLDLPAFDAAAASQMGVPEPASALLASFVLCIAALARRRAVKI